MPFLRIQTNAALAADRADGLLAAATKRRFRPASASPSATS